MEGGGITSTGVHLYAGVPAYGVAVDPRVIRYGSLLRIWPNPFHTRRPFVAFDTGSAIVGARIDFYDWLGRHHQNQWGIRPVNVQVVRWTTHTRAREVVRTSNTRPPTYVDGTN